MSAQTPAPPAIFGRRGGHFCLSRQCCPVGRDIVLVQIAVAVGVLIEIQQLQSRFQLAGKLLVRGMGKLDAAFVLFQLAHLRFILERVKRKRVDDPRLILVKSKIQAVVKPGQQPSAGLQDPCAFAPDGQHRVDVAVGDGVKKSDQSCFRQTAGALSCRRERW